MKIPAPYQKLDGSYAAVMDIKQHDKAKRLIGETFESDFGVLRLVSAKAVRVGRVDRCEVALVAV